MNAPKASAQKWKLARKFELYWEQTVLLCPYFLIHCFTLVSWCINIIPEIVFFPCVWKGWVSHSSFHHLWDTSCPTPAISSWLSEAQLFKPHWAQSAVLLSLADKRVWLVPSQIFPLLCVSIVHLKLPFFGYKAVSFHAFSCCLWIVAWVPGRKRKSVMGSCCLWGEKLYKLRQPFGLQDFSWPEMANFMGRDNIPGHISAIPSSSKLLNP